MSLRIALIIAASAACVASVAGVVVQGRQLSELREEHQRVLREQSPSPDATLPAPDVKLLTTNDSAAPSLELLRLRNDVNRLSNQRREMEKVAAENDRLRIEVARQATNTTRRSVFPPGTISRTSARKLGFNSPEDSFETMLWAIANRDLPTMMEAIDTKSQEKIKRQMEGKTEDEFWKGSESMPPMRVTNRRNLPDGGMELDLEMPMVEKTEKIKFSLVNGQWKVRMDK